MVRSVASVRICAKVAYCLPFASMPSVLRMLFAVASTHSWCPPSELYPISKLPDHGAMASALAQAALAASGSNFRLPLPVSESFQPSIAGLVKSSAGVLVLLKIYWVI